MTQVAFPDVSGTTGWDGSTGGADSSSPYASPADYSWTSGATQLGSTTLTATDGAGLTTDDSLTISADSTAPTGQAATLVGGPWYSTASVPVSLDDGTDAQSGVDATSGAVERQSATLADGTCDTFGAWAPVTLSGGADTTVAGDHCYRYRYTISDNVGNASAPSTASAAAKVDTTDPTVSVDAPTAVTGAGAQYYDAGSTTLWFRPSGSGSFALNATATAGGSGVADVTFPDLSSLDGFTGAGGPDTSAPYGSAEYSWTSGANADPGSRNVVVTSNVGTDAIAPITISPDSTAPTGHSAALSGGPWYRPPPSR